MIFIKSNKKRESNTREGVKVKEIGQEKLKIWNIRISRILTLIRFLLSGGVITTKDLIAFSNSLPLAPKYDNQCEVEIISVDNSYSEALINHPLCRNCFTGILNYNDHQRKVFFVEISIDSPNGLLSELPIKPENLWMPTNISTIQLILWKMGVTPSSYLCDAGAGDCRTGFVSPCKTDCIENNPILTEVARTWQRQFKTSQTQIISGDLYQHDLSPYSHIFLSLTYHNPAKLSQKLAGEVAKGAKIFSIFNSLDSGFFSIENVIPIVLNDSQFSPITIGFIQRRL